MILLALSCTTVTLDTPPASDLSGLESLRRAHGLVDDQGLLVGASDYHPAAVYWSQDLPVLDEAPGCEDGLCLQASPALASPLLADGQVLLQLGFSGPAERPPLNLVLAVDSSGSLGAERLGQLQHLLEVVVGHLDEGDLASLVLFDDAVTVANKPEPMDASARQDLVANVRDLQSQGSTELEAGLAAAYSLASGNHGKGDRVSRVLLFTEQPPKADGVEAGSVLGQARTHGLAGIGLSVVALGNELGGDFAWELERSAGGVYLPLGEDEIELALQGGLEPVVPWATQIQVQVLPPEGWEVEGSALMGLEEASDAAWLGGAHLSDRRSRLVAVAPAVGTVQTLSPGQDLGRVELSWLDPWGQPQEDGVELSWAGDSVYEYTAAHGDSLGSFGVSLFHDQAIALDAVAQVCAGEVEPAYAQGLVQQAASRLEAGGLVLEGLSEDSGEPAELDLSEELLREADFLYAIDGLLGDQAGCAEEGS